MVDLYELTMAAGYFREGMNGEATFSLFIRDYPPNRSYFVAAGLEHLKTLLQDFRFRDDSLAYLTRTGRFSGPFLDYLRSLRFSGTVRAIPEGRIVFAQEPLVEVTAPIIEAQLLETLILNVVQMETMIATKAARCVHAARGRGLIDFSFRRTQGVEAGVKVARCSYLAGFLGTSNVLAGKLHGIPIFGTMAHSYVTSFATEMEAFRAYARAFPDHTVLLIDTYDTLSGARKALEVARELASQGHRLMGVRLDSGDLAALSRQVRAVFTEAGYGDVSIMASGSLDEYSLQKLLEAGAEIDIFAVGTRMGVSADAPYCDIVYKLVEYDGRPVLKLSSGKKTWVGKKQVFRRYDETGLMCEDALGVLGVDREDADELLTVVFQNGRLAAPLESLEQIRARFTRDWERLPGVFKELDGTARYPVRIAPGLRELDRRVTESISRSEIRL